MVALGGISGRQSTGRRARRKVRWRNKRAGSRLTKKTEERKTASLVVQEGVKIRGDQIEMEAEGVIEGEVTGEEVIEVEEVVKEEGGVEVKVVGEEHCQEKILPKRLPEVVLVVVEGDFLVVVLHPPPLDLREQDVE